MPTTELSFIGLMAVVITATWVLFIHRRNSDLRAIELLSKRVSFLETRSVPIAAAFQAMLATKLTHTHTQELDDLLAHAGPPSSLSSSDWERMRVLLVERYETNDPQISPEEKEIAYIFPFVVKIARIEFDDIEQGKNPAKKD